MKKNLLPSLVLGCICIVVAVLLSVLNIFTAPIIAERQNAAANAALVEVLPGATKFDDLTIDDKYPSVVEKGWKADNGFVFQMNVSGYNPGLIIMCGVSSDGKITGVKHIVTNETFGLEGELNGVYLGKDIDSAELIVATGATPNSSTSKAYYDAIKAALQSAIVAGGGEVDIRTPEQILQDNCNAALGTTDVKYSRWFATEILEGIDAVYEAGDKSGKVYVIGESFVGIKADGTVVAGSAGADAQAKATAANSIINASVLTEITEFGFDVDPDITKAYVTASGNYVFEVIGKGYKYESNVEFAGIEDGEFNIKVSISADGKIIDVVTVSHEESKGYGELCATEEYYEQYRGAGNDDIVITVPFPDFHDDQIANDCTDIGAISSSTFTSTGYQVAVKVAFEAFELLTNTEGGND